MWQQIRSFNRSNAGKQAGWCLRNVRMGYGIAPVYADAWDAWNGTPQKRNRNIPTGVDVPLYYSYTTTINGVRKNYGHINVRLKDGRIWNDGNYFSSLSAFEKAWSNVSYVGWSTHVNNVQVIKEKTVNTVTKNVLNHLYRFYLGRPRTSYGDNNYLGKTTFDETVKGLRDSNTYKQLIKQASEGKLDPKDHQPSAIRKVFVNPLQSDLKQATDSLSKQRDENKRLATQLNDKQKEVDALSDKKADLGKAIEILKKDNKRLKDEVESQDGTMTALGHLRMAIKKALHLQ